MVRKFFLLIGLLVATFLSVAISWRFTQPIYSQLAESFIAISILYFLFKFLFEGVVSERIETMKTRYSLRKISSILFTTVLLLVLLNIWAVDTQTLVVSYGLIAAGVAIALQDVFKNIAGSVLIFSTAIYRVGDRIEVNGVRGDVIDIGVLNTSVLEIGNWVKGDQPTGRISLIPNGLALSHEVHNYSKEHLFIWDELMLPVTYESDWKKAARIMEDVAHKHTEELMKKANKELRAMAKKFYVPEKSTVPAVFVMPNENWVALNLRYIAPTLERRVLKNTILRDVLTKLKTAKNIEVASTRTEVTNVVAD